MDHNKFSSLYSAAVVTFVRYICYCRRGKGSKWGSILPQKSSRATLKERLTSFIRQHSTLETTTLTLRFHRLFDSLYTCSKSDWKPMKGSFTMESPYIKLILLFLQEKISGGVFIAYKIRLGLKIVYRRQFNSLCMFGSIPSLKFFRKLCVAYYKQQTQRLNHVSSGRLQER